MIVRHVGIIPDGNRRWARLHKVSLESAYMRGLSVLKKTVVKLFDLPVHSITVYALSYENCIARSREERVILEKVVEAGLDALKLLASREELSIRFYGNPALLSERVRLKVEELRDLSSNSSLAVNIGICYKPGDEARIAEKTQPIDLVIRTGGYKRLSGFFPNLSAYAELYFTEKLWPDFSEEDIEEAIAWFVRQKRNFGR